jgi:hypothetical protein
MVLRSQIFTGDALSHVAFTGALGALAVGIGDPKREKPVDRADSQQDRPVGAAETTRARVCPANVWRRRTMNQPITAARTATPR